MSNSGRRWGTEVVASYLMPGSEMIQGEGYVGLSHQKQMKRVAGDIDVG